MKPSPLSAVLADDLLLDQVAARIPAQDDLSTLLLALAEQADTPLGRPHGTRRFRRRRGLTVLAALGVAASGATVAAAVERAPGAEHAGSVPHGGLSGLQAAQALGLRTGGESPFQSRLFLPGVPKDAAAAGAAATPLAGTEASETSPLNGTLVGSSSTGADAATRNADGAQNADVSASGGRVTAASDELAASQSASASGASGQSGYGQAGQGTQATGQGQATSNGQANGNGQGGGTQDEQPTRDKRRVKTMPPVPVVGPTTGDQSSASPTPNSTTPATTQSTPTPVATSSATSAPSATTDSTSAATATPTSDPSPTTSTP
jgi:hypothetical protein